MIRYICFKAIKIKEFFMDGTLATIIAVAIIILIIATIIIISKKLHKSFISCNKCKTKYDYDSDVSWKEVSRSNSNQTGSSYSIKSKVEFNCTCHKCGARKTFFKEFVVYRYDAKSDKAQNWNLEDLVEKYFR